MSLYTALINWIMNNYEWIFGGFGVSVIGWIFFKENNNQVQKNGDNSLNIQVGKNLNIETA